MSVYIKEKPIFLEKALRSVWDEQTLKPTEIVLIEDGPLTNELYEVIETFQKRCSCLVRYHFDENVQLGRALAKGVELCTNELVARMDTDDICVSTRFQLQYEYMMSHPEIAATGGWIEEFDDSTSYATIKKMPETSEEILKYGKYRNPLNHMTVMFRRSKVLEVGNYVHYPLMEDYHLWNRMLANKDKMYNLQEVLVRMRIDDYTYERRGGNEYYRNYMDLRKEQKKLGLLTISEYIKASILTWGMTSSAVNGIRKFLYQKILRKFNKTKTREDK